MLLVDICDTLIHSYATGFQCPIAVSRRHGLCSSINAVGIYLTYSRIRCIQGKALYQHLYRIYVLLYQYGFHFINELRCEV